MSKNIKRRRIARRPKWLAGQSNHIRNLHLPRFAVSIVLISGLATHVNANGLYENRPWQFETPQEKSSKAGVLDLVERKKGGFYDGFNTVVYNTTNIGSQINCNNTATTNANIADNGQGGAAPTSAPQTSTSSSAVGSESSTDLAGSGADSGSDSATNNQQNEGALNAETSGTSVGSSLNDFVIGSTNQNIDNQQSNSGTLSSSLQDSVACTLDGAKLTGSVDSSVNGIPSGSLN